MTERDRLLAYLRQAGLSTARAEANLDAFAHELAEQQRTALPDVMESWGGHLHQDVISEVIDVIDPKVSAASALPDKGKIA
ncbi:hypothetical protein [Streptomyces aureus]|uniref:hypothetical protein n=1 Tax=Streptomyces aureus TaxID=193461 RepID=UPI00055B42C8|nr:hypothetical protein [Streptomyces aureus]